MLRVLGAQGKGGAWSARHVHAVLVILIERWRPSHLLSRAGKALHLPQFSSAFQVIAALRHPLAALPIPALPSPDLSPLPPPLPSPTPLPSYLGHGFVFARIQFRFSDSALFFVTHLRTVAQDTCCNTAQDIHKV